MQLLVIRVALLCWCVAVAAVTGCGPSNAQIQTAKAAQYKAPGQTLLDVAIQVAQQKYKIGGVDAQALTFATVPQFYTKEGGRISATNEFTGDFVSASEGDVQLTLVVEIVATDPEHVVVNITPKTLQVVAGSPQPRPLLPTDPDLPPWIHGRVDALAVAIYDAAKQYVQ
jgi:hypothetical protein